MAAEQLLKFTVQHYRKAGVSEDNFVKWMKEVHVPSAIKLIQKHNIVNYSVFITPTFLQHAFTAEIEQLKKPWSMANFDAVTSYWVRSPDDMRGLLTDPEWLQSINEPEKEWVAAENVVVLAGFETVYLQDGKICNVQPKEN
ncbi:hypothetical protein F5884DRAFT_873860 [Xylogone sp. PMI_703]|nr:hypothetical protein F5884DRAFT_873860 [Xylogone sp. PMI_703]